MNIDKVSAALSQELEELPIEETKVERPLLIHKTCNVCAIKKNVELFRPMTMNLKGRIYYSAKCRECLSKYERNMYLSKHPNAQGIRGRKSQFDNEEVKSSIVAAIATGASIRSIAIKLGFSYNTLYSAYKAGKFSAEIQTIVNEND